MMRLTFITLLSIGLVIGCVTSTKELMPPADELLPPSYDLTSHRDTNTLNEYLKNISESSQQKGVMWWTTYKRAQMWTEEDPILACQLFLRVTMDPLFPLRDVSLLRARQVCPSGHPELKNLMTNLKLRKEPWLNTLLAEVELTEARRENDRRRIMQLTYSASKKSVVRQHKIQYTEEALKLARELKDKRYERKFLARLYRLSPRLNPKPRSRDDLRVAYDYRRVRDFDSARKYYRKVLKRRVSFATKLKALNGIRITHKLERRLDLYGKATEEMARQAERHYRRHRKTQSQRRMFFNTHITLARTMWTLGRDSKAQATLKMIEKKLKGKYSMATVYWLRGRMAEEKQKFELATNWFEKALMEPLADNSFKERIRWYQAWNLRKMGMHEKAIDIFKDLKETTENPYQRSRYSYWLGKTLLDAGIDDDAFVNFNELIEEDPLGFYGLMAHREVEKPLFYKAKFAKKKDTQILNTNLQSFIDTRYSRWLVSVGETQIAHEYLNHVAKRYKKMGNPVEEGWVELFHIYAQAGHYIQLFSQLGELNPQDRRNILEKHPEILFPTPYHPVVKQASSKYGISSEFIFAIMRQESAFNPQARSHADAFGLMQILPSVAKRESKPAGIKYKRPDDLYQPRTNISIGAHFLKKLWDKYDEKFILTVASYNASDEAIAGWLKTRFRGDALEFIEDVPYEETQGYIKLVMRNLIFYQLIESQGKEVPFPEWCLYLGNPDA